jgi:hypothetical protein
VLAQADTTQADNLTFPPDATVVEHGLDRAEWLFRLHSQGTVVQRQLNDSQ